MKTYTLFTFIALLFLTMYAQAQVVKGTVVDAVTGNPIPQASIYLNGVFRTVKLRRQCKRYWPV